MKKSKVIVVRQEGERRENPIQISERERFQRKRQEIAETLPCATTLATLAATIERGKPFSVAGAGELARNALMLWETCDRHLKSEIDTRARAAINNEDELEFSGQIVRPKSFPASLADFERLVVPGDNEADRRATYRDFLHEYLRGIENPNGSVGRETTFEAVNTEIERNLNEPWSENFFIVRARKFLEWKKEHDEKTRSARASAGGAAMKVKAAAKRAKLGTR